MSAFVNFWPAQLSCKARFKICVHSKFCYACLRIAMEGTGKMILGPEAVRRVHIDRFEVQVLHTYFVT